MIKKLLLINFLAFTVLVVAQQSYYSDVNLNLNGLDLKNELATKIINTHTNTLNYSEAREALKVTDLAPQQSVNVLLMYGYVNSSTCGSNSINNRLRSKNSFGGGSCQWNREHTYPKSKGTPNLGTSGPGADAHHLRATDVRKNSNRGSLKFNVRTNSGNAGKSGNGWYPGDEWKGDVARMVMYMYLRYGNQCLPKNVTIGTANSIDRNMIDLLLKWNAEDPVSTYEDLRNEYLSNTNNRYGQGNRNPFIDNPYLATRIWGGIKAQDRWNNGSGINDTEPPTAPTNLAVSNVTDSSITLSWNAATDNVAINRYEILLNGNIVVASTSNLNYTITELTPQTTYIYVIKAIDSSGNSTNSNSLTTTTKSSNNGGVNTATCVKETFNNIGRKSSSYSTRTWQGDNGLEWKATSARTDQELTGKAITIRRDGELTTQTNNGISSFKVTTKRVFKGGSGTFDLNVNGIKVGTISYSGSEQTTIIDDINISGTVSITITKNSPSSNRVILDDLSWKCYGGTAGIKKNNLNELKVFPNPTKTGNVTIALPNPTEVTSIEVFSILGKRVYTLKNPAISNGKIAVQGLKSGIYILKISNTTRSVTKKLVVR